MQPELKKEEIIFEGIPMNSISFRHPVDQTLFAYQVTGGFQDSSGVFHKFTGFSLKNDPVLAIEIAATEVLERLFASRHIYLKCEIRELLESSNLLNGQFHRELAIEEVFIREYNALPWKRSSASGLAMSADPDYALKHGAYEIIERDLLCRCWYADLKLTPINEKKPISQGYFLSHYTIHSLAFPFVLSIIESDEKPIFFCGSAVSNSIAAAQEKSSMEALHLLTNILFPNENRGSSNVDETSKRIKSLSDYRALAYQEHFKNCLLEPSSQIDPHKNFEFSEILEKSNLNPEDFHFVKLRRHGKLFLYRVLHDKALTKNLARHIFKEKMPSDPFC